PAQPADPPGAAALARRRPARRLQDRRDQGGRDRRPVVAALGRPDRADGGLGAAAGRGRVHGLRGQLHSPRLPGQLAGRRRPLPLSMPRRRLLRRRAGGRRAAAEAAAALHGAGAERNRPGTDPAAADRLVIKQLYRWLDDRLGLSSAIMPVVEHPVPRSINWWYVLGSATLVAFTAQ